MAESYDGFISYSHAADDLLAPRLQAGLQRFAKPWWKRRAVRIFRDESSLSANPHLWSSITDALDGSEWFVLLLSENAAQSEWVNREVQYWLEHKPADRILPVVTDGEFGWAEGDVSVSSTAAPPALSGVFSEEPRWVDLRWARTDEHLDLSNPLFSDAVADIASAIRGIPKDELASEEVRQHRRTIRTAWAAGVVVLLLAIAAAVGAIVAVGQSIEAQDQRDEAQHQAEIAQVERNTAQEERDRADELAAAEAEARSDAEVQRQAAEENAAEATRQAEIAARERDSAQRERDRADAEAQTARAEALAANAQVVLTEDPELSVLLAAQALSLDHRPAAMAAMHAALQEHRAIFRTDAKGPDLPGATAIGGISPDGELVIVSKALGNTIELWQVDARSLVWGESVAAPWVVVNLGFSTDGQGVVVYETNGLRPDLTDPGPARLRILDPMTGATTSMIPLPDCSGYAFWPTKDLPFYDLSLPFIWTVDDDCSTATPEGHVGLLDPDTGIFTPVRAVRVFPVSAIGSPTHDAERRLLAIDDAEGEDGLVLDIDTGEVVFTHPGGMATLSPDGARLLGGSDLDSPLEMWDVEAGRLLWAFGEQAGFKRAWFSIDGDVVYAAGFNGGAFVLDALTGTELLHLRGPRGVMSGLSMSHDRKRLATFSSNGTVLVWDIGTEVLSEGDLLPTFAADKILAPGLSAVANGRAVVWGAEPTVDGKWKWETVVVDLQSSEVLFGSMGGSAALSPDGSLVALRPVHEVFLTDEVLGGRGVPGVHAQLGEVWVYDVATGTLMAEIDAPCNPYLVDTASLPADGCDGADHMPEWLRRWSLAISPENRLVAVSDGTDATVTFFSLATTAPVFAERVRGLVPGFVHFSTDGSLVSVHFGESGGTGAIRVYETQSFSVVAEIPYARGESDSEFTPDGELLVTFDFGGVVAFYDTSDFSLITTFEAHQGNVFDVSINASSTLMASLGADAIRVWNLADFSLHADIPLGGRVERFDFIDDDSILVFPQIGSTAAVIELDPTVLAATGLARVTRALTQSECATYGIDPCPTTLGALRGA